MSDAVLRVLLQAARRPAAPRLLRGPRARPLEHVRRLQGCGRSRGSGLLRRCVPEGALAVAPGKAGMPGAGSGAGEICVAVEPGEFDAARPCGEGVGDIDKMRLSITARAPTRSSSLSARSTAPSTSTRSPARCGMPSRRTRPSSSGRSSPSRASCASARLGCTSAAPPKSTTAKVAHPDLALVVPSHLAAAELLLINAGSA